MDKITLSLLDDFVKNNGFEKLKEESIKFEYFCNYSIVSKEYSESFDVSSVSTGDSTGIDGLAVLVNGRLVESREEIDDLLELNKYIEATFIFIQAKTSNGFDSGEMSKFFFAVQDFFSASPSLPYDENIEIKRDLKNYLYEKIPNMTKGLPQCKLYFVTTGSWNNEMALQAICDGCKKALEGMAIFEIVVLNQLGAREIQKYYQRTKETISANIIFSDKVVMPEINGISEAHIGVINFNEFKKLIIDDEGKILSSIFYDNVRAFQGENLVNKKIRSNLENGGFDKFVVLNNGITIVARSIVAAGNKFTINDYQIVNGCQTSHVLYSLRDFSGMEKVNIPIKLIVSSDESLINEIITATNSQTVVKPEELEALSEFQKNLELYYKTTKDVGKLYYERRSRQYDTNPSITKTRIINIPIQIKCFASMFLKEPHKVSRYYGSIVKDLGGKIFVAGHRPIAYYTCAYAYYKLDQMIRGEVIHKKYKKCRFFMLMLLPSLVNNHDIPALNSNAMDVYCSNILDQLFDTDKSHELFKKCADLIDSCNIDFNNRDEFKKQSITELILSKLN